MADVTKTNAVINSSAELTKVAAAASQTIVCDKDNMIIIVENGTGADLTATISKGTGIAGVADLAITIATGKTRVIGPLESAKYKNMSTGKMTLALSATTSSYVSVIQF